MAKINILGLISGTVIVYRTWKLKRNGFLRENFMRNNKPWTSLANFLGIFAWVTKTSFHFFLTKKCVRLTQESVTVACAKNLSSNKYTLLEKIELLICLSFFGFCCKGLRTMQERSHSPAQGSQITVWSKVSYLKNIQKSMQYWNCSSTLK